MIKIRDFSGFLDMGAGYLGFREIHEEDWAENWKTLSDHSPDRPVGWLLIPAGWIIRLPG